MADIFISYAREDADRVRRIAERLRAGGYDVWWDRKIGGGAVFAREIERELKDAGVVLVAWSAAAAASHWVVDEATEGRDAGKLVPISLDGAPAPLGFRQYQVINFADPQAEEAAFRDLETTIERIFESGWRKKDAAVAVAVPLASAPTPRVEPARRMPRALLVSLAVFALGAAAAIFAWAARQPAPPAAHAVGAAAANATSDATAIAVLPFTFAGGGDGGEDAAARLAGDVAAALMREPWLSVESARSVAAAAATEPGVSKLAAELDVAYLVDGELRNGGGGIGVSLHALSAASGARVWSLNETFAAGELADPDVAAQIANSIWRALYVAEAARVRDAPRGGLDARRATALALAGVRHAPWTEEGARESVELLKDAVAAFPDDADLLATAAQTQSALALFDPAGSASLREESVKLLDRAFALDPQSRWVEHVAADMRFASGRYYAAAEGYDRLLGRGHSLPSIRARRADARARVDGGFEGAAATAIEESRRAFIPLQRSQTHSAAAYMKAAASDGPAAFEHARLGAAAAPNNPDAVLALLIVSMIAGPDAALTESVATFCNFYPSLGLPPPGQAGALAAQLSGDGGAQWRAFVDRVFDAYAARWPIIEAACVRR